MSRVGNSLLKSGRLAALRMRSSRFFQAVNHGLLVPRTSDSVHERLVSEPMFPSRNAGGADGAPAARSEASTAGEYRRQDPRGPEGTERPMK